MKNHVDQGSARRKGIVHREIVEALHDILVVLLTLIGEFSDLKDRSTLLDAMQKVLDVSLAHDERGGYGIHPALGEGDAEGQA